MGRNLIVGDIHGMYDRLIDALERAGFDPMRDTLYSTGDLCDRGPDAVEVIRFLMGLDDFRPVLGNHDIWLQDYLSAGKDPMLWTRMNGGSATIEDFERRGVRDRERREMLEWLLSIPYARATDRFLVLHGGPCLGMSESDIIGLSKRKRDLDSEADPVEDVPAALWDRDYIMQEIPPIDTSRRIFVGHTPLRYPFLNDEYRLVGVDTGSFLPNGRITVLDMDALEFWQSSPERGDAS